MLKLIQRLIAFTFLATILLGLFITLGYFYGLNTEDKVKETISKVTTRINPNKNPQVESKSFPKPPQKLRFALIADSHSDLKNLEAALTKIKEDKVDFIIGLGDYSDVGTREELSLSKNLFDESGIPYYVIPGDHDLWDSRDKNLSDPTFNFRYVFGPTYQSFSKDQVKFILINNADNYLGLDEKQLSWFKTELKNINTSAKLTFLFIHEPLFNPTSAHIMGRVKKSVDEQRKELLNLISRSKVEEVFSGDIHFFSRYEDNQTRVKITTVGSVTTERNGQGPRFAEVVVFDDYTYEVKDIVIGD